jgi:DNA-binding beta-propeller fold protein YncE
MMVDCIAEKMPFSATRQVRDAIAALHRTEDIRFSPSNRRLAIAQFNDNKVAVFYISITADDGQKRVEITGSAEIVSSHLKGPHGLDFLNERQIFVANRYGNACVFELPLGAAGTCELTPLAIIDSGERGPGAVAIARQGEGRYEALVCNNFSNDITKYVLRSEPTLSNPYSEVLVKKWLDIPDGICISNGAELIAVSNHTTHSVLLFRYNPNLTADCDPIGVLREINYPHGLRFTRDNRFILVASAGSPYVNMYERSNVDWKGTHKAALSIKVMTDSEFSRNRSNRQEGGPKGVDIDNSMGVFVTTSEGQPISFFDLDAIVAGTRRIARARNRLVRNHKMLGVKIALHRGRVSAAAFTVLKSARNTVRSALNIRALSSRSRRSRADSVN